MPRAKILTIEDDAAIRRGIVDALRFAGYDVLQSGHGVEGTELAVRQDYDLLLLDLVLPGRDGLEILRDVRRTPAHAAGDHPLRPRRRGRPGGRAEAGCGRLRGQAVQRQGIAGSRGSRAAAVAPAARGRRRRRRAGRAGRFRPPRGRALRTAAASSCRSARAICCATWWSTAGRAISREELLDNVWRISPQGLPTRTIDMHVARLREKLRDDPAEPRVLLTVRGKGYMFAAGEGPETP